MAGTFQSDAFENSAFDVPSGASSVTAAASQQVGGFTQTAIASAIAQAVAGQQVDAFGQTATLAVQALGITAQAAQTIGNFAQSATASGIVGAAAAQTVAPFAGTQSLAGIVSGSSNQQVAPFAQFATLAGEQSTSSASADQQIGDFGQSATLQAGDGGVSAGGGGYSQLDIDRLRRARRRKKEEEARALEVAESLRIEAERQAADALASFEESERQKHIARLDRMVEAYATPAPDAASIQKAASEVVSQLMDYMSGEFDRLIAEHEFQRDEEEAISMLLLALAA